MTDDTHALGTGATGDPENPALSRKDFNALSGAGDDSADHVDDDAPYALSGDGDDGSDDADDASL